MLRHSTTPRTTLVWRHLVHLTVEVYRQVRAHVCQSTQKGVGCRLIKRQCHSHWRRGEDIRCCCQQMFWWVQGSVVYSIMINTCHSSFMSRGVRRGNSHSPLREIALELEPLLQRRARCIHVVEQRRHAAIDELAASALRALCRMTVSASEGCWCVTHCARNNNELGNSDSFQNVSGLGLGRDGQEQQIYCRV